MGGEQAGVGLGEERIGVAPAGRGHQPLDLLALGDQRVDLARWRITPGWSASVGSRASRLTATASPRIERLFQLGEGGDARDCDLVAAAMLAGVVAVVQERLVPEGGPLGILLVQGQAGADRIQHVQ